MKNETALQSTSFSQQRQGPTSSEAGRAETPIRWQIRHYIIDDLLLGTVENVEDGESLSQSGILDSTGALELVAFLEERFAIVIEDHDLTPENLDTIDGIVTLVERKQAESALIGG